MLKELPNYYSKIDAKQSWQFLQILKAKLNDLFKQNQGDISKNK